MSEEFWTAEESPMTIKGPQYAIGQQAQPRRSALPFTVRCYGDAKRDALCADLRAANGWRHTVCVPLAPIRRAVAQYLQAAQPTPAEPVPELSGWLHSLARAVNPLAHKAALKSLARQVEAIAQHPLFKKGMAYAGTLFPPLGVSYGAVRAGTELIAKVRAGDPEARGKLTTIAKLAAEGHPAALDTTALLRNLLGIEPHGAGAAVSGAPWYATPWQGVRPQAGRYLYWQGLNPKKKIGLGDIFNVFRTR
jgi:hypothetical protein